MKILIIGHGRHGKDTVAELLVQRVPELSFASSSFWCADKAVRPALERIGIEYASLEECYEDRVNHREFWAHAISEYNTPKDRLIKEITEAHDIYVGLRSREEFEAGKHHFDLILWVDRSSRLPPDPTCELNMHDADSVVDNNFSMAFLRREVVGFSEGIRQQLAKEKSNV